MLLTVAAHAASVPGTDARVRVGGWLDGRAVVDTGGGPRQRPQLSGDVVFDAAITRLLAARLELRGGFGGPIEGGSGAAFANYADAFQNHSPLIDAPEAWIEARLRRVEVRAGLQRFAWGKLDGVPPTDVVNPRDWHDPFVDDAEERKLGVPALSTTAWLPDVPRLALSDLRAQVILLPFGIPPRLALTQERWFPPSTTAVQLPIRLTRTQPGPAGTPVDIPIRVTPVGFATRNDPPARQWSDGGVGLRLGGTARSVDWDLYYYDGPETAPDLRLEPVVQRIDCPKRQPPGTVCLRGLGRFVQESGSMRMTGGDLAVPLGGFTLRLEAAYLDDRRYLRPGTDVLAGVQRRLVRRGNVDDVVSGTPARLWSPPLFATLDAVEWGVGVDYLWRGWQPLLQLTQVLPVESAPPLLIADPETRLLGAVRKRFLDERLEVEFRGQIAVEREAWFVYPRVSWRLWDAVRLRLGYLLIDGPPASLVGQFHANDEVTFEARYSF